MLLLHATAALPTLLAETSLLTSEQASKIVLDCLSRHETLRAWHASMGVPPMFSGPSGLSGVQPHFCKSSLIRRSSVSCSFLFMVSYEVAYI
jgi:hypothetical protein